ncbi:MAG: glycosyltransferase family 4 protein [Clostridiaceae bacterium]|nr:glycosyltransferase family 4 protein [Clostridiaceae bacterium]
MKNNRYKPEKLTVRRQEKRNKILFCASTVSHINNFHLPYLKAFKEMGYEVHVAVNENADISFADRVFTIPFQKNIFSLKNLYAIFKLRNLIKTERYEKISSNTTLAGLIVRFSVMLLKDRPVIYHIAHGYHFSLNQGIKKYLYLVPEKIVSSVSDHVMVMNHEDYLMAKKYKLFKHKLHYIDGIGIDKNRFKSVNSEEKHILRSRMGLSDKDFVFVYVAEFSKRKNQELLIKAFAQCNLDKCFLLLAGDGKELEKCRRLAEKLNQTDRIRFLGYVEDVPSLLAACDAVVSTSQSEGLPFNIIEAMGCGLPVIASDIKGHRELVEHGRTGLLYEPGNIYKLTECMITLYLAKANQTNLLREFGTAGTKKAEKYTLDHVLPRVMEIYTIT